ncbi:TrbG/VirB9 family P-type conjugative transfer protein [Ramlibacter alkalitolerans]|uniref:TrbG/VirB9 family P-type conjugative transfer protein n=1 Tax=Ramlibacter alkalitolerans TaxID=2039631 RepID=A0ABS1JW67_9BURK|nr:TrbG/VirB9 family P-type conjugative transfer protein [Ramlibacter alkalitolerans]MBL0427785.1 TrbG/VirB9 family P-type conjugative transfer protein [Ramlibacter alkalitolerans]
MKTKLFALSIAAAACLASGVAFAAGAADAPDLSGMFQGTPAKPVPAAAAVGPTAKPTPVAGPGQTVLQPVQLTPSGPAVVVDSASVPNIKPVGPGLAVPVTSGEKPAAKKSTGKKSAGSSAAAAPAAAAAPKARGVEAAAGGPTGEKMEPALVALNKWLGRTTGVHVENGVVKFPYGLMEPVLVCAPLHICDIEMEAGETIQNVSVGDTARWQLSPAQQGTTQHIVVKPMISEDEGVISTNVLVTTSKRTYTLTLKSSPTDFVPRIGWYYPQDVVQTWSVGANPAAAAGKADEGETPIAQVDMAKVNLDYSVEGDEMLKPTKVFDDGKRLFLQMPDLSNDAPAVMVDDRLVNYRYRDGFYVIDRVGAKTTLLIGVGREQRKVEITKGRRAKLFGIF